MKLIITHKKQLVRPSDVKRFIAYIYGKQCDRPVLPIEGYLPGLPTGNPTLDTESLLASHHGGKAAKGRSIVISSEYFPQKQAALDHAPAMAKSASAFRTAWSPQSNGLSVVHLTQGKDNYAGMWRLDCHLIVANSDGKRGIQWTANQCSEMQDMEWIPAAVRDRYNISSGKGSGIRRTQKIPYPKAENLIAYEIGKLTNHQIENGLACGFYGAARRAKDGRVISIEAEGKRINIDRARHLVTVRDGVKSSGGILQDAEFTTDGSRRELANLGIGEDATCSAFETGLDYELGGGGEKGKGAAIDCIRQRRRRLSSRGAGLSFRRVRTPALGAANRQGETVSLACVRPAGTILNCTRQGVKHLINAINSVENIQLINTNL